MNDVQVDWSVLSMSNLNFAVTNSCKVTYVHYNMIKNIIKLKHVIKKEQKSEMNEDTE